VVGALGGEPGLTPNLDALIRGSDWAGRAIAPSSEGVPSMASLFTGLRPWQHQALHSRQANLSPALLTLPEALQAAGYQTAGFSGQPSYSGTFGYDQGFDRLGDLERWGEAAGRLKGMRGRQFVWIHIAEPAAPYTRRPKLGDRVKTGGLDLPLRVLPNQLEPYFDPAVPLPPGERQLFWAMYQLNVAFADDRLGRCLEALRQSGQWDHALVVVTSTHGEEFGERHQILNGGNLGRQLLEVPLAVKLPAGSRLKIAVPRDQRVAAARIWATLVEAGGGEAGPAVAPSLFRNFGHTPVPVLSELYFTNGTN
jgi:arylsulfatase A-like enzyme